MRPPSKVFSYPVFALAFRAIYAWAAGEDVHEGISMPSSERIASEPMPLSVPVDNPVQGTNTVSHSAPAQPVQGALSLNWVAPWIRVQSEASSSQGTTTVRDEIPAFQHPSPNGHVWGPFEVGKRLFEDKPYPRQIPVFRHLYQRSDIISVNFEDFVNPDRRLYTHGNLFFPEPQQLYQIQVTLWNMLRAQGIRPRSVGTRTKLFDLLWLWPPTEIAVDQAGLQIPEVDLKTRIRKALGTRLQHHLRPAAKMFHLKVTTVEGGMRHILMMPVYSENFVDLVRHPRQSELWFFYEGFLHGEIRKMAFLGAMYMPLIAEHALTKSEDFSAAFTHAFARDFL